MADQQPAIVLVHGFRGGAAHWAKVVPELHRRGFGRLHAVENPPTSLADDAERTRARLRRPPVDQAGEVPRELRAGPVAREAAASESGT
ncbi:hypothetical protein [Streptomyces sp. NPDC051704]|uniref:hypothetical protein n=1 Tax=Streptomyces sp. NPDC051704 TaxID=3365671 RepID=UPI0037979B2A